MQVGNKVYYSYRINYRHLIDIGQWGPEVGDQIKCFIFGCFLSTIKSEIFLNNFMSYNF